MKSRRTLILILPLAAALALAAAWGAGLLGDRELESAGRGTLVGLTREAVRFDTVVRTAVSPWAKEGALVVRRADQWESLLDRHAAEDRRHLLPGDLSLDWDREMAVVVAMGQTPNDGADLRIVDVYREDGDLHVDVVREAGRGRRAGDPLAPIHVVRIPRQEVGEVVVNVLSDPGERTAETSSWGNLKRRFGN